MGTLYAEGPDGRVWVVRRRWAPRLGMEKVRTRARQRFRKVLRRTGGLSDISAEGFFNLLMESLFLGLAVVLGVLLFYFLVLPLLVVVVDVIVVALLAVLGVVARIVLRRPWTVEASSQSSGGVVHTWRVVGWKDSGEHCAEIARRITAGKPLPLEL